MTTDKTFKILSIDGGGIRGLYSARILQVFEERYRCRVVDHFDLLCGTSTGGIIALGLAVGMSAAEIAKFYTEYGPGIFPPSYQFFRGIKQILGHGKYDNQALKNALTEKFGEKRIKDSQSLLCIPSHSITHARPYIFKYDHREGNLGRDNEIKMVDVALATSAAPTYLPVVEIGGEHNQFVDGGVCANNPAMVGLLEALKYFVGEDKGFAKAKMLSIGTLSPPAGRLVQKMKRRGAIHWKGDLIGLFSEGQAKMTNFAVAQLCESEFTPCCYTRIPASEVAPEQARILSLDNTSEDALQFLRSAGKDVGDQWAVKPEIIEFFSEPKHYQIQEEAK